MAARPPYAVKHEGPVLICGPAPSLYRDFQAARALYPEAALFAVSWAIRAVKASHVLSNHYEKAAELRALAAHDWPGHRFVLHSQPPMQRWDRGKEFPAVDHFWDEAADCANSAVAAARVALAIGFEEAVFCGVALDGTPGYAFDTGSPCFWEPTIAPHAGELVMAEFARFADSMKGRVFAMSGGPRILFGLPPRAMGDA